MNIDIIIGNPPYQKIVGGGTITQLGLNLYGEFVSMGLNINPKGLSFIIPTRWYLGETKSDKQLREELVYQGKLREIHDFPKSQDIFPNNSIAGGICYFLWDNEYNGEVTIYSKDGTTFKQNPLKYGCIIRDNKMLSILDKVNSLADCGFTSRDNCVLSFGIETYVRGTVEKTSENQVLCRTSKGDFYIDKSLVLTNHQQINKYKLILGYKSPDRGGCKPSSTWNVISKPQIINPGSVHTHTYTSVYCGTLEECNNVNKYIRTKFSRFMILIMTASTTLSTKVYQYLPLQDFTSNSDINWNDSIDTINKFLYKKYNLTDDEISHIENLISTMDLE